MPELLANACDWPLSPVRERALGVVLARDLARSVAPVRDLATPGWARRVISEARHVAARRLDREERAQAYAAFEALRAPSVAAELEALGVEALLGLVLAVRDGEAAVASPLVFSAVGYAQAVSPMALEILLAVLVTR